jgi:predicted DCC family thiol-disulfide oxidoreductase YuxK
MTMPTTTAYPLMLFFDGACPLCRLEMDRLRERDGLRRLVFVDIAEPGFDPAPWAVTLADMQALIHAARPDGSLLIGIDALHQAYTAVGLGHWTVPTTLPGLRPLLGRAYALFARRALPNLGHADALADPAGSGARPATHPSLRGWWQLPGEPHSH